MHLAVASIPVTDALRRRAGGVSKGLGAAETIHTPRRAECRVWWWSVLAARFDEKADI